MTKRISAVIITFNEEKNIERCLLSLKEVVDEILVVDSYSTDGTERICANHNVRFIQNPFEGHIEQKNFAMRMASNDWVLSLDADEALSTEMKKSVLKADISGDVHAYSFNRLNNYCGQWIRHSGWYPDRKTRLWNRQFGHWGGENPHDKVMIEDGGKVVHLNGDILHYSYYSVEEHDKQLRKFAEISAKSKFNKGKKASLLKVYVSPAFKFLRNYFFKLGFLDGRNGWIICRKSAYENYLKYKSLRALYQNKT